MKKPPNWDTLTPEQRAQVRWIRHELGHARVAGHLPSSRYGRFIYSPIAWTMDDWLDWSATSMIVNEELAKEK